MTVIVAWQETWQYTHLNDNPRGRRRGGTHLHGLVRLLHPLGVEFGARVGERALRSVEQHGREVRGGLGARGLDRIAHLLGARGRQREWRNQTEEKYIKRVRMIKQERRNFYKTSGNQE